MSNINQSSYSCPSGQMVCYRLVRSDSKPFLAITNQLVITSPSITTTVVWRPSAREWGWEQHKANRVWGKGGEAPDLLCWCQSLWHRAAPPLTLLREDGSSVLQASHHLLCQPCTLTGDICSTSSLCCCSLQEFSQVWLDLTNFSCQMRPVYGIMIHHLVIVKDAMNIQG